MQVLFRFLQCDRSVDFLQVSYQSVSYTHLDVYKRQHYELLAKKQGAGCAVQLRKRVVDIQTHTDPILFETDKLILRIDADRRKYTFFAGPDEMCIRDSL